MNTFIIIAVIDRIKKQAILAEILSIETLSSCFLYLNTDDINAINEIAINIFNIEFIIINVIIIYLNNVNLLSSFFASSIRCTHIL